ncbi:site-2 protease family protein [Iningainema tapete]|uniref:Site-2 protease family protein n=1 Tax=Iningainema tapete BLCC-T55 TaxID=2748662 RepID=A0A8J6XCL9_9CYAN|nr:site-2 protease family protein [Iningainema tapete]MBD2770603.1 site-2 protease family protein [Iningainema tapete BLCC-T55]
MFIKTLMLDPVLFFRIVILMIFSISLHELAHGLAAISQGDDTPQKRGHITLNPVVHMGWQSIIFLCVAGISWGKMPVDPNKFRSPKLGNIIVSSAGPLSNLALGILCVILIKLIATGGIFSREFFYIAAHINVSLFLFNLLPIPPLDGFHVFSEIFPALKPLENTQFGLFALVLLFVIPEFAEGLGAISDLIIKTIMNI